MRYLSFERSDDADGLTTLEAMAATPADQQAAVMAEVQQVLDWAWQHCPHSHGPVDDGMDRDHDVLMAIEGGHWHAVTLPWAGSTRFVAHFLAVFGGPVD